MAEIARPPQRGVTEDGDDVVCFTDDHTLADIVRWIMSNRVDAEEVHRMLGEELEKPALMPTTHSRFVPAMSEAPFYRKRLKSRGGDMDLQSAASPLRQLAFVMV